MRFALTADHCAFFNKHAFIELEGVLPLDQLADLKKNAEETLATRLRLPAAQISKRSTSELFLAGYDLWRDNDAIKKTTQKNAFARLALELFQTPSLRYGFDQLIYTTQGVPPLFSEPYTLQEISCLSPLAGALILPLEDLPHSLPFFPVPIHSGNGLFISSSLPIPWPELFATPKLRLLMIVYAMKKTHFRPDTRDPHAAHLKKLGYAFNDPLKNSLHPLL
jgi:hypothetical protein